MNISIRIFLLFVGVLSYSTDIFGDVKGQDHFPKELRGLEIGHSSKGEFSADILDLFITRDNGTVLTPGEFLRFNGDDPSLALNFRAHVLNPSCSQYTVEYQLSNRKGVYDNSATIVTPWTDNCPIGPDCDSEHLPNNPLKQRREVASGAIYNIRARVHYLMHMYLNDNGHWSCLSNVTKDVVTPWTDFSPHQLGIRTPEDWTGTFQTPLDISPLNGYQLDDLTEVRLIPDDVVMRYDSSHESPYRAEFNILADRIDDLDRISDGSYAIRLKSTVPCNLKLDALRIGQVGKTEWIPLKEQKITKVFSWVFSEFPSDLRRFFIYHDGLNAQMTLHFTCEANEPFQLGIDVMGLSKQVMRDISFRRNVSVGKAP
ncbi:hypothetical protein [Aquirhabdus parva]|uniref:Uncharacterized protein n=1 Tax=Aquirhabdus parva TaxID=2283318 RepID=A0A345P7T4_9GAMM|nr:hypothetical protein [Aquirhabdus parva]AXI03343.1 hypothetical protein HYN46_11115 [Aquirhabdus parva]